MSAWFYLLFFVTGATGLIFETAFARQFQLVFGCTLSAISVVIAVFFGGIALGAAWLGRYADRYSPLRFYGVLEIVAGLCAFAAVLLVPAVRGLYASLYPMFAGSEFVQVLVQALMAAVLLLPCTVFMGASLPALSRGLTLSMGERFTRISMLYGLNTFGAACGTLLCGFLLLEFLGYRFSVLFATSINLAIGLIAFALAKRLEGGAAISMASQAKQDKQKSDADAVAEKSATRKNTTNKPSEAKTDEPLSPSSGGDDRTRFVLLLAGFSGLAALGFEVAWFRILSFTVVTDAYAFALMLGVYLLGIGGGGIIAAWRFRKKEGTFLELGIMECVLSLLAIIGFMVFIKYNPQIAVPDSDTAGYWSRILLNTTLRALILILPPTLIMGYVFPMMISLYASQRDRLGGQVGRVVGVNTAGSIVGSIACGFVFIPLVGIQMSLMLFALLSALIGIIIFLRAPLSSGTRKKALACSAPVLLLAFFAFPFQEHFGFTQLAGHEKADLIFYSESADQTVIVTRDRGAEKVQRLLLNQQQATSTVLEGQRKNQLLGHLPMWACPDAKEALVICFGSGGTFGALGLYDLERVVCVDLCPTVIEAAPLFKKWNNDVLSRPNVEIVHDDGRSFLLTTEESYDIITLEPMHPGLKGVSSLYSTEFYEEAKKKLRPNGVLCQWIPLYNMSDEDARILTATAVEVFPQSTLWLIGAEGVLMCHNSEPFIQWDWLKKKFYEESIHPSLTRVRIDDPWAILSGYLLGPEGLKAHLEGVPVMDDDRPFTEYSIPRHQHLSPWNYILEYSEKRESPLPLLKGIDEAELESLETELAARREAWIERDKGFAAFSQKQPSRARELLEKAIEKDPSDRYTAFFLQKIYRFFGDNFSQQRRYNDALVAYTRALQLEPGDADLLFFRAMVHAHMKNLKQARQDAEEALKNAPDHEGAGQLLEEF